MIKTTHNLIIIDRSGSMSTIREQTISGINSTLRSIRQVALETGIRQQVSICSFCSCNLKVIYQNTPIEKVQNITAADYQPCCMTPLYDAIGICCTRLEEMLNIVSDISEHAVSVTIITDGEENASTRFSLHSVSELIKRLKAKGWLFAFIGANIDVKRVSVNLNIDNSMSFNPTPEGTRIMFDKECSARVKWSKRCCSEIPFESDDMNLNYFESED